MSFLPIVERELRIATRRKGTYRVRSWTTLIAVLVSFFSAPIVWFSGRGMSGAGASLFSILTGYVFFLCSLSGMFLTAGSLAEEKRDGTLGLLFLTDLKGYDVVLGKFIGRAVNPYYAFAALVPVIGVPLLLGGVTGSEFSRTALALGNALFVSLAIGVFVSSVSRDPRNASAGTFFLVLLVFYLLPSLATVPVGSAWSALLRAFNWLSPAQPFVHAAESNNAGRTAAFWMPLLVSSLFGCTMLIVASVILPRMWQDRVVVARSGILRRWFINGGAQRRGRTARQRELLARNPISWLALAGMSGNRVMWLVVLASGVVFAGLALFSQPAEPMAIYWSAKGFGFVLKMLAAFEVCRFFVEHRRTGALELLFSTPLQPKQIVSGQILAVQRRFAVPLLTFFALALVALGYELAQTIEQGGMSGVGTKILTFGSGGGMALWFTLGFAADLCAIVWVGMWLALSMKKPTMAPAMTILAVLIIPSIGFCFLDLLADLFLVIWAVTNLKSDMRWVIARQNQYSE